MGTKQGELEDLGKGLERSISFNYWEFTQSKLEACDHSKRRNHETLQIKKPTILLPEPVTLSTDSTPLPVSKLDAAATKVQKVYKSYRTRRNLADCAVLVEELWWQALDFAALKRSSVSFYNIEKHESAESRWSRARTRAAKVGKGLCKDEKAQKLALQHWLEAIDPRHRYGHNLQFYHDVWSNSKSTQPFFYWLDVGDGKDTNLNKCPRSPLQRQCIQYLGPKERVAYEVIVENGKLVYRQRGMRVDTVEGSKWIFVLSTSRALYVGQKKKGTFQHSSFLSGGATTAAGRLVAHNGVLEAIWPYSGHYLPTEDNFKEFIIFLKEHQVDLTTVKMCATDDDKASFKVPYEESSPEINADNPDRPKINGSNGSIPIDHQHERVGPNIANAEGPVCDPSRRLSCKWASGLGPRIGCVRDYPVNLQCKALEQVNLSPKVPLSLRGSCCAPIPSPRPSTKIRVSPRLAFMGLPTPTVLVRANSAM